jgi:hypothetical protein
MTRCRIDHSPTIADGGNVRLTLAPFRAIRARTEHSMRGLLMAFLAIDFPGMTAGRDRSCIRVTKTLAKKTTVTTV